MTRVTRALGVLLVALGLVWAGRESAHGVTALWEHWWCPLPLVAILLGVIALSLGRLSGSST